MLGDFIDFATSVFPSVDSSKSQIAKQALRKLVNGNPRQPNQLEHELNYVNLLQSCQDNDLIQGDILGQVKFFHIDDEGSLFEKSSFAIILTNTCDIENDDLLILSVCYPETEFFSAFSHLNEYEIKQNKIGNYFYIYKSSGMSYICDLSHCTTYSKILVQTLIKDKKLQKHETLTQVGWYILLLKLTFHFMRPEDRETHLSRPIS